MEEIIQKHEINNYQLLSGSQVETAKLGFCVFGNPSKPVVVLHTAVSGNPRAYSENKKHYGDGWWNRNFGSHKMLDTEMFQIICFSHFGGNGPSSTADELQTSRSFLSILDTCHLAARTLKELGITKIHAAIGVSMGGAIAREWLFQDYVGVEKCVEIFPNFGNNHVGCVAKDYVQIQIDLLHSDGSNLESIQKRIADNCGSMCTETRAYAFVYNHIMSEFQTLYEDFSDENVLRVTRMVGFLRFVTPEFFQQKWDEFYCARQDQAFANEQLKNFCNHLGDSFIKTFRRSSLASLRYMDARPKPVNPDVIATRILQKQARVLGLIVRGDRLYDSDLQFDYYQALKSALPEAEMERVRIHVCHNLLRGHDHFLSEEFLAEGQVIRDFLLSQ